jgi:hypothetical protein
VDRLAKEAIQIKIIIKYATPPKDQQIIIKMQIMKEYQNIWWQTNLSTPIKHYKEVQAYVHTNPMYNTYKLPRSMIGSIIEIRTQKDIIILYYT